MSDIKKMLGENATAVTNLLDTLLPVDQEKPESRLIEAMRYAALSSLKPWLLQWLAGPLTQSMAALRVDTSVPLVLIITVMNGIAEEIFFRGALYAAIPQRWTVIATTTVYALTTVVAGVPLLVFAAVVLGVVCGLQRRVTGGVLGPAITHITWSAGMLLLLPPLLSIVS